MPATATQTEERTLKPITPETRECLLKYFQSRPPERPLTDKEFDSIRDYVNRTRSGLTKEAYEMLKDDRELVRAAAISQARKNQRIMDCRAPEVRELLLKALRAEPGEKNLTPAEFGKVAVFLNPKDRGVRHYAYRLFKGDKEVIQAAEENRAKWREFEAKQDKNANHSKDPATVRAETERKIAAIRGSRTKGTSKARNQEPEPGD